MRYVIIIFLFANMFLLNGKAYGQELRILKIKVIKTTDNFTRGSCDEIYIRYLEGNNLQKFDIVKDGCEGKTYWPKFKRKLDLTASREFIVYVCEEDGGVYVQNGTNPDPFYDDDFIGSFKVTVSENNQVSYSPDKNCKIKDGNIIDLKNNKVGGHYRITIQ